LGGYWSDVTGKFDAITANYATFMQFPVRPGSEDIINYICFRLYNEDVIYN